jgi:hypothetical protein
MRSSATAGVRGRLPCPHGRADFVAGTRSWLGWQLQGGGGHLQLAVGLIELACVLLQLLRGLHPHGDVLGRSPGKPLAAFSFLPLGSDAIITCGLELYSPIAGAGRRIRSSLTPFGRVCAAESRSVASPVERARQLRHNFAGFLVPCSAGLLTNSQAPLN